MDDLFGLFFYVDKVLVRWLASKKICFECFPCLAMEVTEEATFGWSHMGGGVIVMRTGQCGMQSALCFW